MIASAIPKIKNISAAFTLALSIFCLMSETSCRKPYDPPATNSPTNYLVIEGLINSGNDSTIIKITRTVTLAQTAADSVTGATVTVEDNQNGSFPLIAQSKGVYASPALSIDKNKQYRLRVKTPDNQVYLSDYEPVLTTPPIDSVGFIPQAAGLEVYINTHDVTNNTKYYRWSYTEAWEFHSFYLSTARILPNNSVVPRDQAHQIYFCYGNSPSSDIPLAFTNNLAQSALFQKQIALIPKTSEKLEMRYGILVKQYALTADAYKFYSNLEKNSDQLGTIFDSQPSQISGNVHCISNPKTPVVGFIGVSTVTTMRAFILQSAMPQTWVATYPASCQIFPPPQNACIPCIYNAENPKQFELIDDSLNHAIPACVDCTTRGKTTPPSFWVP